MDDIKQLSQAESQNTQIYQLSIKHILKNSWKLFTENFKEIIIITLIIWLPITLISSCFELWNPNISTVTQLKFDQYLEFFIGIIATIAVTIYLSYRLHNKQISIKVALLGATSIYRKVIFTNIVITFFLIGLFILFIIPGIIYGIYWSFVIYPVILYKKNIKDARKYSYDLVKGRWWKVAWYIFCFGLMFLVICILMGTISALAGIILGWGTAFTDSNFIWSMLSGIMVSVIWSFFIVVSFVFFVSLDSNRPILVKKSK